MLHQLHFKRSGGLPDIVEEAKFWIKELRHKYLDDCKVFYKNIWVHHL